MSRYNKALKLIQKGNRLIDLTKEVIRSAERDVHSVETVQLSIQHERLCREIDLESRNFTPEQIIGGIL